MEAIILFINKLFDILWIPLSFFPSYIDIIIISTISAISILFIFKKTSNQERIKSHKRRITAYILQIRLYKDKPFITLKSAIHILIENILYLRFNLPPLLIITIPVIIVSIQLNNRYGYLPINAGDCFIIQADIDKAYVPDAEVFLEEIALNPPPEIRINAPPVKIIDSGKIFWRARLLGFENSELLIKLSADKDERIIEKTVFTTCNVNGFSPNKNKFRLKNFFLNNAEGFLPKDSSFQSISIHYTRATFRFLYWNVDSIILYFLFTLIIALVFKPLIKVTI